MLDIKKSAEKLHLPQVTYVTEIKKDGNALTVKRQLEDGYMELKLSLIHISLWRWSRG